MRPFRWQRNWICRGVKRPENPVTCFPPGRRGPRSGAGVYEGIWRNDALCGHRRRQRRHSYSSPQSGDTTTLLYNPFTQPAAPAAPLAPERTPPLNLLNPRRLCRLSYFKLLITRKSWGVRKGVYGFPRYRDRVSTRLLIWGASTCIMSERSRRLPMPQGRSSER